MAAGVQIPSGTPEHILIHIDSNLCGRGDRERSERNQGKPPEVFPIEHRLIHTGAVSSAGEHLPYKEGVAGSNPAPPTK